VITLLFCAPGHEAAKTFLPDGSVKAYDLGYKFEHAEIPLAGLIDLGKVIESVAQTPGVVAIRGRVIPGAPDWINRTMKPKPGRPPFIESADRQWVCWDHDKTDIPFDPNNPEAAVMALVARYPEGLREASFVWQLSSSQHKHPTLRCHIWQWLDRPYSDQELKQYARRIQYGPDRSLFNAVQPHYVSNPVFIGQADPLPVRLGYVEGLRQWGQILVGETNRLKEQALSLLDKAVREIRNIKQGEARHPVVNRWSYALGQLTPHLLSEVEVFNRIQEACLSGRDPMPLDRIADEVRRGIDDGAKTPKLAGESWKAYIEYEGKDFRVAGTAANASVIMAHDAKWNGVLAYNDRSQQIVLLRNPPVPDHLAGPPAPRDWNQGSDATRTAAWFSQEYRARMHTKDINAAAEAVAEENRFDPVRDWLEDLQWDGMSRLDNLAADYLGATKPYEGQVLAKFCLAAVARAYEPGCKVDATLILEGEEGLGKTTFLEELASRAWYASVQVDLSSKDAIQYIHGPWISDFSEIAAFKKTGQTEAIKDFLSRSYDRVRLPYKPTVVDLPRRGVFAATTNEKQYLASRTGNRRMRPILCTRLKTLPPGIREQVWAEAKHRYLAGEDVWKIEDEAGLKQAQQDRELDRHDAWHDEAVKYLRRVSTTTIADILSLALVIPVDRQDNRAQQRVTRILQDLSWTRSRSGDGRSWKAPPDWLPITTSSHTSPN
jgi:predicted P-loop ATPase